MKSVKAVELTQSKLEGFGRVVSELSGQPDENEGFNYWDKITEIDIEPPQSTGIVEGFAKDFKVEEVERHVETPEIMVALEGDFVTFLGRPDSSVDQLNNFNAFHVKRGQGLVMNKGTWHSVPAPVGEGCKVLIIFKSGTPDNDIQVEELAEKIEIIPN